VNVGGENPTAVSLVADHFSARRLWAPRSGLAWRCSAATNTSTRRCVHTQRCTRRRGTGAPGRVGGLRQASTRKLTHTRGASTQVIDDSKHLTLVGLGSVSKAVREALENGDKESATKSTAAAAVVGRLLAEKCKEKGIEMVVFDRGGFKYHGRISVRSSQE